jgi:hypothetical protein
MVHKTQKVSYDIHVPYSQDVEMISVGHPDAELLKVFLLKDEKAAFKEFAAKKGEPMYHLVRKYILAAMETGSDND